MSRGRARMDLFPYFPRRLFLLPQALKESLVAKCIHALPKIFMPICRQLSGGGKPFQCVGLKTAVIRVEVFENFRFEYQKTAIDPAFANLWFFSEIRDDVAVKNQSSKSSRRPNRRYRSGSAVRLVELAKLFQVHIANPVAIRKHESLVLKPWLQAFHPTTRIGEFSGVFQVHDPVFAILGSCLHFAG